MPEGTLRDHLSWPAEGCVSEFEAAGRRMDQRAREHWESAVQWLLAGVSSERSPGRAARPPAVLAELVGFSSKAASPSEHAADPPARGTARTRPVPGRSRFDQRSYVCVRVHGARAAFDTDEREQPFIVVYCRSVQGRGLVATRKIAEGDIVLAMEQPAKAKAAERISEEKIVVEMLNAPRVAAPHGAIIHTDSGIFYGASWGSRPPPWYYLNHGGVLGGALGKAANLELVAVGELGSLAWRATRVILPCEELLFRYDDVPASWGARARAEQPFCVRVPPRRP